MQLSTSNVVVAPSRELLRAAGRIDTAIAAFLKQRPAEAIARERWEAPKHAWTLSNLALRQGQATLALARSDVVFLPGAWATCRAALEAALKASWLMSPDDEWEREARWLALADEDRRFSQHLAVAHPELHDLLEAHAIASFEFLDGIRQLLPGHVSVPSGTPSMEAMAEQAGDGIYNVYRWGSQFVHATDPAVALLYRTYVGTEAVLGEVVCDYQWTQPLRIAWEAVALGMRAVMHATKSQVTIDFAVYHAQLSRHSKSSLGRVLHLRPTHRTKESSHGRFHS